MGPLIHSSVLLPATNSVCLKYLILLLLVSSGLFVFFRTPLLSFSFPPSLFTCLPLSSFCSPQLSMAHPLFTLIFRNSRALQQWLQWVSEGTHAKPLGHCLAYAPGTTDDAAGQLQLANARKRTQKCTNASQSKADSQVPRYRWQTQSSCSFPLKPSPSKRNKKGAGGYWRIGAVCRSSVVQNLLQLRYASVEADITVTLQS